MGGSNKTFYYPYRPGDRFCPLRPHTQNTIIRRRVVRAARPIGPGRKLLPYPLHTTPKFRATSSGPNTPLGLIRTHTHTHTQRTSVPPSGHRRRPRLIVVVYKYILLLYKHDINVIVVITVTAAIIYISRYCFNHYYNNNNIR